MTVMTKSEVIEELRVLHTTYDGVGGVVGTTVADVLREAIAIVEEIDETLPTGLTKAEYFAAAALAGGCANPRSDDQDYDSAAHDAKMHGEALARLFEEQGQ